MPEDSRERVTLAIVAAKLDGLRDFTDARLTDVQRQLDTVSGLPIIVNGIVERQRQFEDRVKDLEEVNEKRREWRIGAAPALLIGLAGVIVSIVALIVASHAPV